MIEPTQVPGPIPPAGGAAQTPPQPPYQPYYQQSSRPGGAGPAPASSVKRSHGTARTFWVAFAGAAVACVVALGGFGIYQATTGGTTGVVLGSQGSAATTGSADENATLAESVAQKALPSVVAIDVYTSQQATMDGLYGFGSQQGGGDTLTESSLGSGVVLTEDGYVITNYHVVEGADALKVTVDGTEHDAEVVGSDPSSDIAVVKVKDVSGLTPIELGDSDDLTIGEWVMSIGSPFGLEQSVATGIVSATNRSQVMDSNDSQYGGSGETTLYTNMIQTDAAINPGNSGGALVDANGKLIGINTLITSYSGNYSGVGFAIPVNYAVNLAQQIIDGKTPTHAQLGVSLSTVNAQIAQRYGFSADSGAYVADVTAGSGAEAAGLKVGDIITAFDGQEVTSASDLMLDVRSKNPGDAATVTINRDGATQDLQVTLGSDEESQAAAQQQQQQQDQGSSALEELLRQYGYGQ